MASMDDIDIDVDAYVQKYRAHQSGKSTSAEVILKKKSERVYAMDFATTYS
jgi:hypothetical protein